MDDPSDGGKVPFKGAEEDDLQAWKRDLKEKERLAAGDTTPKEPEAPVSNSDGLDDIQRFKLKIKEEQERRTQGDSTPNDLGAPPGLSSGIDSGVLTAVTVSSRPDDQPHTGSFVSSTPNDLAPQASAPVHASFDQSVLSVAGLDSEYSRDYTFSRLASTDTLPSSSITNRHINGRLTPTHSSLATSNITLTTPNSSNISPSAYNIERTESPGTNQSIGKGSRFAKFWDNRPKEQSAGNSGGSNNSTPSTAAGVPVSLGLGGPFSNTWGANSSIARPPSNGVGAGGQKSLDGLFSQLNVDSPSPHHHHHHQQQLHHQQQQQQQLLSHQQQHQARNGLAPPFPGAGNPDTDRMTNLLSMLNPPQVSLSPIHVATCSDWLSYRFG